jgi:hypothetical protein
LAPIAVTLGLALLCAQPATARTVSRLPRSDYTVRAACATPVPGHAGCLALQLVPQTAEARAHTHPLGVASAALSTPPSPAAGKFGVRPQDLHDAYQLPTNAPSAQTIALVDAYNDPSAEADLETYSREFGIPECTAASGCFKQVNQDGEATNLPFPKTRAILTEDEQRCFEEGSEEACFLTEEAEGWAVEISLDIETAHAVCQNCQIALVEADSASYANLETAENSAARLGADEISNSWAGPECVKGSCLGEDAAFNHPGVVIAAAAGDNGYLNWLERSRSAYADFPASSPQVVAVGGTRLNLGPGGEWNGETVWNDGGESKGVKDGHGAAGGGCSSGFEAPLWQQDVADWTTVGCGDKRAVADVSADADPYTGVAVYDSGPGEECESEFEVHWCTYGGTSVATPLIAATFALAGGANGVEYPAKTLYENEAKSPASLHDVTEGSNGECLSPFDEKTGMPSCTTAEEAKTSCNSEAICLTRTGYDGPTGVGTPDGISAFAPASAPTVATGTASAITQTSATLRATVNPNGGKVSECKLEYGTSTVEESSAACSSLPGSGTSPVAVSAPASGLSANTTYHFRISATNANGTSMGNEQAFRTLPNPPTVTTGEATSLASTSAKLNAEVDPNGGELSECQLEYGTVAAGEQHVPCSSSPGSGTSPVAVSAPVSDLSANTTYHFRISATNAGGTSKGSEQTFRTLNSPTAVTGAASSVKQTTAMLEATVNPNGENVTGCRFEYGTTAADETSVPCSSLPGPGTGPVTVSAPVGDLDPNTTYLFRISATNGGGTSEGGEETFKTLPDPPSVTAGAPTSITQTGAVLNATVNPDGVQVSGCKFEYGTTTSYGSSASCNPSPGSADSVVAVSASLTGLTAGAVYHFRIVAANAGGAYEGPDQTLTTLLPTTLSSQIPGGQGATGSLGVASSQEHKNPPVPDAELASTSLTESATGNITVTVSCPIDESSCAGTVTLRTLNPVSVSASAHQSKKPKATILTLAADSFQVAGGHVTRVKLHLSAKARALLASARAHLLRARATVFAHDPAGNTHTTQSTVTIRAAKAVGNRKD